MDKSKSFKGEMASVTVISYKDTADGGADIVLDVNGPFIKLVRNSLNKKRLSKKDIRGFIDGLLAAKLRSVKSGDKLGFDNGELFVSPSPNEAGGNNVNAP